MAHLCEMVFGGFHTWLPQDPIRADVAGATVTQCRVTDAILSAGLPSLPGQAQLRH